MAIKLAISNMKGGIGKTTTALCLADCLKNKGKKVLLIDTDPQRSATGVYGAAVEDTSTLADMMYSNADAKECIQHLPLGDMIPSDQVLMDADTQIKADTDRFYHLKDTCESIENDYDFIILDCPPGNGVMLGNVLSYADHVIMPITCDKFGIQGMSEFVEVLNSYKKRINPSISIIGVLIIKYKGRQSLTKDLEDNLIPALIKEMGTKLFSTKIRESIKCQEAQAMNESLFTYAPSCTTAEDYVEFTKELIKELKK